MGKRGENELLLPSDSPEPGMKEVPPREENPSDLSSKRKRGNGCSELLPIPLRPGAQQAASQPRLLPPALEHVQGRGPCCSGSRYLEPDCR